MTHIGARIKVNDVGTAYLRLADQDEAAAIDLLRAGRYRHALYQTVQAMEKRIRARALLLSDAPEQLCHQLERTHSLIDSLEALISNVSPNERVRKQVRDMLCRNVLEGINFARLHNDLRYPFYLPERQSFMVLEVSLSDAQAMLRRSQILQRYLQDFHRIHSASG
jgi:HEPN domain-containing protein